MSLSRPPGFSSSRRDVRGARARTTLVPLAAALLLSLSLPATDAGAQEVEIRVVPAAGVLIPTSVLYRSDLPPAKGDLGNAPLLSLGLHAAADNLPFSFRVTADRAAWLDTDVHGTAGQEVHPFTVPTTITMFTGDLLIHPVRGEVWMPYAFAGLGWKDYSFGSEQPTDTIGFNFPEDGASARIHYGVGVEAQVGEQPIVTELGGSYNRFVLVDDVRDTSRPHPQHEFVLRLAVPLQILTF